VIIAFMGMDGTGKTTICKTLERMLKKMGYVTAYREEFNYFLLEYFLKAVRKILGEEKTSTMKADFLKGRRPSWHKFWVYAVWLDLLIEYISIRLFKKSVVTIMDRYAYDFLIGWEHVEYDDKFIQVMYSRFPKPDFIFTLDIRAEVALERKKLTHHQDLNYYKEFRKMYMKVARDLKIDVINTEEPIESTINRIFQKLNPIT